MSIVTEHDLPENRAPDLLRQMRIRDALRRLRLAMAEIAIAEHHAAEARATFDGVRVELVELRSEGRDLQDAA